MSSNASFTLRALLSIGLLVGFYVIALGTAFALILIAYVDVTTGTLVHLKVVLFAGFGALVILYSIFPRIDRFLPPGPRVSANQEGELFAMIREVAKAAEQKPPAEVYVVPDVNAWVAQRGGWIGIGSRRVMGLGLPLLGLLSRNEFKAVLAHEFGHYHHGDTMLGPVIHKARSTIFRTVSNLAEQESILHHPFLWYGKMFMRITQSISRQQEFVADALAARLYGRRSLSSALKKIHSEAQAFIPYYQGDVAPVLNSGFRPPIAEGFQAFVRSEAVKKQTARILEEELQESRSDPYDSHPTLKDRLDRIREEGSEDGEIESGDAIEAVESVDEIERRILAWSSGEEAVKTLRTIGWREVPEKIYLPAWKSMVAQHADPLNGIMSGEVAGHVLDPDKARSRFEGYFPGHITPELHMSHVFSASVALAMIRSGWKIVSGPGLAIELRKGDLSADPFQELAKVREGHLTVDEWKRFCEESGVADVDLGEIART
ncbi:MAG: M48 family metalloprotease [Gemmatimonadetes bacterium]|nr:M48 family metalloprotease [Gemmatimonadota bacterium]